MKHGSSALALQYVPQCLLTRSLSLRSRQHAIAIAHNRAFRPQRHQPQGHQRATATPYARTIECEWLRCSRPHHCTHRDQQVRSGQCRDHTQHACGGRGRCPRCRPAVIRSGGRHRRCEGYRTKVQSCDRHDGATRFCTIHRSIRAGRDVVAHHWCCTKPRESSPLPFHTITRISHPPGTARPSMLSRIACPASTQYVQRAPPGSESASTYSEMVTACCTLQRSISNPTHAKTTCSLRVLGSDASVRPSSVAKSF